MNVRVGLKVALSEKHDDYEKFEGSPFIITSVKRDKRSVEGNIQIVKTGMLLSEKDRVSLWVFADEIKLFKKSAVV